MRSSSRVLCLAATLIFLFVVARAHRQSITIDEADSYLTFVHREDTYFHPASANHVLNSLVSKFFTSRLGTSHLTVRSAAILGAAVYLLACAYLTAVVFPAGLAGLLAFLCLTLNPFILDHLVAARGYSMALGFYAAAIATLARLMIARPASVIPWCAAGSLSLALCFVANFSFALAAVMLWFALAWAALRPDVRRWSITAALVLPGLLAYFGLAHRTVMEWPRGQLWYGAKSWTETFWRMLQTSTYHLPAAFVDPFRYEKFQETLIWWIAAVGVIWLFRIATVARKRQDLGPRDLRLISFATALILLFAGTIAAHQVANWSLGLLLPLDRTAGFLLLLITLSLAIPLGIPVSGGGSRAALACALASCVLFFALCLRISYFREWRFDADVRDVYQVLEKLERERGIHHAGAHWLYSASLNFYRVMSGNQTLQPFVAVNKGGDLKAYPPDADAYVLWFPEDYSFIEDEKLEVAYRGPLSDVVVAIRPRTAAR
ncbi:MAG: hypothetical protein K2X35_25055 [Bryobacteraceae bacterium]|nr:hypothetical protein [Bryobacteraceae bacterium]